MPAPSIEAGIATNEQEVLAAGMSPILPNAALPMAGPDTPGTAKAETPPPDDQPVAETDPRLVAVSAYPRPP